MNIGDVVKIKQTDAFDNFLYQAGEIGIIVGTGKRLYVPAFQVLINKQIVEFDYDELEVIQ